MPTPKKGVAYSFDTTLVNASARPSFKASPTLAAGDVKISKDEGALTNLTTLPTVSPAGGANVYVPLSATEMTADRISIFFTDQTLPKEWDDVHIFLDTTTFTVDDLATSEQVDQLSATGSAIAVPAKSAPDGFVLTTGSEVNDEDSTKSLDGVRHELTDAAGTLDGYYKFDIGASGSPTSVTIKSVVNGVNDTFGIYVNTGSSSVPVWEQRGSITGTNSSDNTVNTYDLFPTDVVSDMQNEVWVRVYGTGLSTSTYDVDQMFVSKSVLQQFSGYDNGLVWIDTVDGTAGTTDGYNGIASRPSLTLADGTAIAASVGLSGFQYSNESSVTFVSSRTNEVHTGLGWTCALGGQDVSGTHINHCNDVSGIATTPTGEVHIMDSHVGAITVGKSHFTNCGFTSTFTAGAAANYIISNCESLVAGSGSPTFNFDGNGASSNVNVRGWKGGATWVFDADCTATIEAPEGGTHTITTGGGNVEFRGTPKSLVITTSGAGTVNVVVWSGCPIVVNGASGTVNVYGMHNGITGTYSGSVTDYGSDITDIPATLAQLADIEGGITHLQAMRVVLAASAGKLDGATGTTVTIRDQADTKDRITATVDGSGNRTAVTLDVS